MGFAFGGSIIAALHLPLSGPNNYSKSNQSTTGKGDHAGDHGTLWVPQDSVGFYALWTAAFTGVLAFSTIGLWIENRLGSNRQVAETRRIGEAQVKAYVDISEVEIVFFSFASTLGGLNIADFQPLVTINAKNTGQSPARNFIWTPAIQYFAVGGDGTPLQGDMGPDWRNHLGIGIPVGGEHSDSALITGVLLQRFLAERRANANVVLVRLRISFEYENVFDGRVIDEAYFAGHYIRDPSKPPIATRWGTTMWSGNISRITRPNDWPTEAGNTAT